MKTMCFMTLSHQGAMAHHNISLVLEPGQPPIAVLEWAAYPDGTDIPSVAVQLEDRYLRPVNGWGEVTHVYEIPVVSPIPLPKRR